MTTTTLHPLPVRRPGGAATGPSVRPKLEATAGSVGSAFGTTVRFLGNLAAACGEVLVLGTHAEH